MYAQLHSSEVGDGYEWGRLNLQSVTEESRLDEFLSTAQLAGTEFTAGECGCMGLCTFSPAYAGHIGRNVWWERKLSHTLWFDHQVQKFSL